jgi:tetratricopeptide (TPR) repeat protein
MEPANPRWRALLLDMEIRAGHKRAATKVARELIAMEGSLFFRLRSLPWLVDLSTLEARLFLAERAAEDGDSSGQQEHLRVAYQLLLSYRLKTAAELLRQTGLDRVYAARDRLARLKNGPVTAYDLANELGLSVQEYGEYINVATHTPLAGETVSQAIDRSRQLLEVAQNLARLLREQGREEAASELIQRAQELVLPPIGMEER